MAVVYVKKSKFKIFRAKPKYAKLKSQTLRLKFFTYTTNNPKNLIGVVAKKGNSLRYE